MMIRAIRMLTAIAATVYLAAGALPASAGSPAVIELLEHVPPDANVVVATDIAAIVESPMGTLKGWKKQLAFAYAEGASIVPPGCVALVQAARLRLADRDPAWEVAAMEFELPLAAAKLRKMLKGQVESAAGMELIHTPRHACCAAVGPSRIIARAPDDRQQFLRWVRERGKAKPPEYLRQAVLSAQAAKAQLVAAIDLTDACDIEHAKAMLAEIEDLKLPPAHVVQLAETLSSIRGVRLEVRFAAEAHATLWVDCAVEARRLQVIPRFREELAERLGLHDDAFKDWKVEFNPTAARLAGTLRPEQLRRLSLLIDTRPIHVDESLVETLKGMPTAEASKRQFQLIATMIDDLRLRAKRIFDTRQHVMWVERYARQIEALPVDNVDAAVHDYRDDVAERLRRIASDVKYGQASWHKRNVQRVVIDKRVGDRSTMKIEADEFPYQSEARAIMGQTARLRAQYQ